MTSLSNGQTFLYEDFWQKKLALAKVLHGRLGVNSNLVESNILFDIIKYLENIHQNQMNFHNIYRESLFSYNENLSEDDNYNSKHYIKGLKITGLDNCRNFQMITFDYSKPIDFFKKVDSKVLLVKAPEMLIVNIPIYNINIFNINKGGVIKETNLNRIRNIRRYGIEICYIDENNNQQILINIPINRNSYYNRKINFYPIIEEFTENYTKVNVDSISLHRFVKYTKYHIKRLLNNSELIYNDKWVNNVFMWLENLYTKDENYNFDSSYDKLIEIFILYRKIITLFPQGPTKQIGICDTFEIIKNMEIYTFQKKYFKKDLGIEKDIFIENNYHLLENKVIKKNALFKKEIKDWFRLQLELYNLDSKKLIPV